MKKLLITLSAVAVTMLAFTATSNADHNVRYLAGYDQCGRPVYAYRCVPSRSYAYGPIQRPTYRGSYGYAPSNRSYGSSSGYTSRSYGSYSGGYSSRSYGGSSGRSYCR